MTLGAPSFSEDRGGLAGPVGSSVHGMTSDLHPSSPTNSRRVNVGDNRERNARNVQPPRRNIPVAARPLAFSITQKELYECSQRAFRDFAGEGFGAAKKIADVIECSEKTAQNYLDGKHVPGGILDLRAYHAIPNYRAMKDEISAMQRDVDPRLQAKLVEAVRFVQQYGDSLFGGEDTRYTRKGREP